MFATLKTLSHWVPESIAWAVAGFVLVILTHRVPPKTHLSLWSTISLGAMTAVLLYVATRLLGWTHENTMNHETLADAQPHMPGWKVFVCVVAAALLAKFLHIWLSPRLSWSIAWFAGWVLLYEIPPRTGERNLAKTLSWSFLSALFFLIVGPP